MNPIKVAKTLNTTAINDYNVAVTRQSGKVGNVRYVQRNGMTYVRSASNSKVTNNRTSAQMIQRLKFASICQLYKLMSAYLRGAFQFKAANQSDYNAFMQKNQGLGVYFAKEQIQQGYSCALPVMVANGSLKEIECEISGANLLTNINIATGAAVDTIAHLSAAIVAANKEWSFGDQLTIVKLAQDEDTHKAEAVFVKIVLDGANTASVASVLGAASIVSGKLAIAIGSDFVGCAGAIHSNKEGKMSTCWLFNKNSDEIADFSSDDQLAIAALSYGESTEIYLRPSSGVQGGGTPEPVVEQGIAKVANASGTEYTAGSAPSTFAGSEGKICITMNNTAEKPNSIKAYKSGGTICAFTSSNISVAGKVITATSTVFGSATDAMSKLELIYSDATYTKEWSTELDSE